MKSIKFYLIMFLYFALGVGATLVVGQEPGDQSRDFLGPSLRLGYVDITALDGHGFSQPLSGRTVHQTSNSIRTQAPLATAAGSDLGPRHMVSDPICLIGADGTIRCNATRPILSTTEWSSVVQSPSTPTPHSKSTAMVATTEELVSQQSFTVYESMKPVAVVNWARRSSRSRNGSLDRWGQLRMQRALLRRSRRH